jgi:uncharacterized secreted protein with C-terminal beta-propeller domain
MKKQIIASIALFLVFALGIGSLAWVFGGTAGTQDPDIGSRQHPQAGTIVSDGREFTLSQIEAVPLAGEIAEVLPAVGDKETLLRLLKERGALYDGSEAVQSYGMDMNGAARSDIAEWADDAMPAPAAEPGMAMESLETNMMDGETDRGSGGSHSETNEQSEGVSEGDIVKTDGRYLYALSGERLRIIQANGAEMELVSAITLDNIWGSEFYLMGDRIAVIGQHYIPWTPMPRDGGGADGEIAIEPHIMMPWRGGRDTTVLLVYDITDRHNPVKIRRVEQEGWAISTRVVGDVVYLITSKHVWAPFERADSDIILPCILDSEEGDTFEPISLDRIFYIPETEDSGYLIIGTLDINGGDAFETNAYLGAGSMIYMSRDSLYVAQTRWDWSGDSNSSNTDILRFEVDGTSVRYTGKGTASGFPINQYSMDEYNGYFRIATTQWGVGTRVTVMDRGMTVTGHTVDLEPNETMQSMRFMGNMGYVVTFENTDPLFTIDLSDPYNPTVLGELKIPGFSQYLHPVGDGLLLGIGRDTTELFTRDANGVETVVGFRDTGLKVSLFDVSDPYNPIEADILLLGEGWTEVSHNPRALLNDPSRGLYGFIMESWGTGTFDDTNSGTAAQLIRVENGRLSIAAALGGRQFNSWNSRLAFIGDTLYLVHDQGVRAYDYYTFTEAGTLNW